MQVADVLRETSSAGTTTTWDVTESGADLTSAYLVRVEQGALGGGHGDQERGALHGHLPLGERWRLHQVWPVQRVCSPDPNQNGSGLTQAVGKSI